MRTNLFTCFILLISTSIWAQDQGNEKFSVGLHIALDQTQMQYRLADWVYQSTSQVKNIDAKARLGFSLGFAGEYHINEKAAFRITPLISFQENRLIFTAENSQMMTFEIQPMSIGLPVHFVFSPRGAQRMPYFFIGPRIQQHLGDQIDPTVFSLNHTDLSGEFGVGIKLHYKWFSIFPQLSFSQGFSDLKAIGQSGIYNNAIRSMNRNRFSLSLIVSR